MPNDEFLMEAIQALNGNATGVSKIKDAQTMTQDSSLDFKLSGLW